MSYNSLANRRRFSRKRNNKSGLEILVLHIRLEEMQFARDTELGSKPTSLFYIILYLHLLLFNLSMAFTGLPVI